MRCFSPRLRPSSISSKKRGGWLDSEGEDLNEAIRSDEAIPDQTQALVASLDGVHVRLDEEGVKQGRPVD